MRDSILIVDDSPNLHKLVRTYLEGESISIHSAFDGSEGISAAARLKPSLILLDVDMPVLDGFEVCRRLKANIATKSLPIIFLTADVSPSNQIKGLDLGAGDYMTKRFKPEELRARIRAALRVKPGLESAAMVDGTTKLWNQNYLDRHFPAQLSLARRTLRPLSCIMVEIDEFQSISRRLGETVAEDVLRFVAHILQSHGRTEDMVCHLDNGKFAMLLPGTDQSGGAQLADRVRAEIERQLADCNGVEVNATCCFGLADTLTGSDTSLVDRADAALFCARRSGRNCISMSQPGVFADAGIY
jgi:two-component system, cell cycle response regulator